MPHELRRGVIWVEPELVAEVQYLHRKERSHLRHASYSREALKGMIANPEDRSESVRKLTEAAGGRLLAYYVTFGEFDWMVISEMPGAKEASAISIIAAASSGTSDVRTTLAMTSAEAKEVFASTGALSGSYRAPGA